MPGPSDETMLAMRRLALDVHVELAIAGLPDANGLSPKISHGTRIELDILDDEDAGVAVTWSAHPALSGAAVQALRDQNLSSPTLPRSHAVSEAMLPAIAAILTTAGFTLVDPDNDVDPTSLRVVAAPPDGGTIAMLER
jgi:hypothetical protein